MKKNMRLLRMLLLISCVSFASSNASDDYRLQPAYLTELLKKLYKGENVIFTKFGDGEYSCMIGLEGKNCDGDTYHDTLGLALKKALISLSKKTNAYIGRWHTPDVYEYHHALAKACAVEIPFVSYHLIMNDDVFLKNPYMHQLVEFLVNTKRKKIVMANKNNRPLKDLFRADVYIELPARSWSFEYQKWKNTLLPHLEKDAILLIAGGLCSKVLINDITDTYDMTCLDIGSSFDIMGGKIKSRYPRLHSYEDELRYYQDLLPPADPSLLITHVKTSIKKALQGVSKLDARALAMKGNSSNKVRHLLNNICTLSYGSYVEIGIGKGDSLVAALFGNMSSIARAVAIDSWSKREVVKREFLKHAAGLLPLESVHWYDQSLSSVNAGSAFTVPISIYFYDSFYAQEKVYQSLRYCNKRFADIFIAIVSNWNEESIKTETRHAFKALGYTVLFEAILPAHGKIDKNPWGNGVYVGVIRKKKSA